jgi:tetratricopeptide (TPR) repeat protein
LYRDFRAISPHSPHSRIRFFEEHETGIRQLEEVEFFELLHAYADALFRTGAYAKFKLIADELIACCLDRHILNYRGEDLFQACIFRKGLACYFLMEYEQAVHLFQELIRIDPNNKVAEKALRRTLYRIKPGPVLNARALSVLLLFSAALVTALELIFVRHFYPDWASLTEVVRIGLFLLGIGILLGSDAYQHRQAWLKAARFAREIRQKKG